MYVFLKYKIELMIFFVRKILKYKCLLKMSGRKNICFFVIKSNVKEI